MPRSPGHQRDLGRNDDRIDRDVVQPAVVLVPDSGGDHDDRQQCAHQGPPRPGPFAVPARDPQSPDPVTGASARGRDEQRLDQDEERSAPTTRCSRRMPRTAGRPPPSRSRTRRCGAASSQGSPGRSAEDRSTCRDSRMSAGRGSRSQPMIPRCGASGRHTRPGRVWPGLAARRNIEETIETLTGNGREIVSTSQPATGDDSITLLELSCSKIRPKCSHTSNRRTSSSSTSASQTSPACSSTSTSPRRRSTMSSSRWVRCSTAPRSAASRRSTSPTCSSFRTSRRPTSTRSASTRRS